MSVASEWNPPEWLGRLDEGPDEVLWNLQGMRRGWQDYPGGMDFLDPDSPNYHWKAFQTRLYTEALGEALCLESDSALEVLDAACGIGRFLLPLARAGHSILGVDACRPSLEAALRHLDAAVASEPELTDRVRLRWDDIDTTELPEEHFDLVLALELLCYLPEPDKTARRLASTLRPGGRLILSVEAWPGALLSARDSLTPRELALACVERKLSLPGEYWVHPMEPDELAAILDRVGLELLQLDGIHFFADGPLADQVVLKQVGDPDYDRELFGLEEALRADPAFNGLSRAWLAVAQKRD